jgi:hypothetical protein
VNFIKVAELDREKLGKVVALFTSLLDVVTDRVINGWLVEKAREMGGIDGLL